jgi:RHS repeat-associated protein
MAHRAQGVALGQEREPEAVSALVLYDACPEQRRRACPERCRRNGARFYSTLTGRFLSPDPLVAAPGDPHDTSRWPKETLAPNPQLFNRYAYVLGNPLRYTDPTGYWCPGCGWIADQAGKVAGALEDAGDWLANSCAGQATRLAVGAVLFVGGGVMVIFIGPGGVVIMTIGVGIALAGPPGSMPLEACFEDECS